MLKNADNPALLMEERPIYWFACLETAVEHGDHKLAAESQQQLARLGVRVQYGSRPRKQVKAVGNA